MDQEKSTIHAGTTHPYLEDQYENLPVVRALTGSLKGKEYRLKDKEYIIGRSSTADIVIDEEKVSRRHAMIFKKNSDFLLSDLGSTNGIFVNNLVMDKAVLKNGDVFQIGSCVFQFIWKRH